MVLSAGALALVLGYLVVVGTNAGAGSGSDEGAAARIFQLFLAADALAIAIFAIRWLGEARRAAIEVLAIQVLAAAIPVVTIVLLEM
jgi:hypothetical protein